MRGWMSDDNQLFFSVLDQNQNLTAQHRHKLIQVVRGSIRWIKHDAWDRADVA
jgi:hypothetical protein